MLISRLPSGKWILGHHNDSVFSCDAISIEAARKRYSRSGGLPLDNKWPKLEKGMYLIPDEFVPTSRVIAQLYGTRFYAGKACKYHSLNHIRMTSTKQCTVCRILEQKGCKASYLDLYSWCQSINQERHNDHPDPQPTL